MFFAPSLICPQCSLGLQIVHLRDEKFSGRLIQWSYHPSCSRVVNCLNCPSHVSKSVFNVNNKKENSQFQFSLALMRNQTKKEIQRLSAQGSLNIHRHYMRTNRLHNCSTQEYFLFLFPGIYLPSSEQNISLEMKRSQSYKYCTTVKTTFDKLLLIVKACNTFAQFLQSSTLRK